MWVAGAESTPKSDFVPDAERTRSPPKPKQHSLASRSVSIPPRSASSHLPASTGGNVATVGRLRKCIGMSHFVKQQFRYPQEEYTNAAKHGSSRGRNVAFMKNHAAQERLAYAMPRSAAMAPQHRSDLMNRLACRVLLGWARGRKRANEGGVQPTSMQNMASNPWRMPEPRKLGVTSRKRASGSYFTQPSRVGSAQQRRQTRRARPETSRNGCSHRAVLLAAAGIPTRARSAPPGPTIDLAEEAYGVVPTAPDLRAA